MFVYALRRALLTTSLLVLLIIIAATTATAQSPDDLSPSEVVDAFYDWYLAPGTADNLPDLPGAAAPYLTDTFIATNLAPSALLCAHDVPLDVATQLLQHDSATAEVLVVMVMAGNPFPHHLTATLLAGDNGWQIDAIACGDDATPLGVTQAFYDWYLAYAWQDPDAPCSPLRDRAYRDVTQLSADLIADTDIYVQDPPLGHYDPFVCSSEMPSAVSLHTLYAYEDNARVAIVSEMDGRDNTAVATLSQGADGWKIERVICGLPPATTVEVLLNDYLQYARYDATYGVDRNPLLDWPINWTYFLGEEMVNGLMQDGLQQTHQGHEVFALTCSADLPNAVTAAVTSCADTAMTVEICGLFPDESTTCRREELRAEITVDLVDGHWQIMQVQCLSD